MLISQMCIVADASSHHRTGTVDFPGTTTMYLHAQVLQSSA